MIFALLILIILAMLASIWYGRTMYAALFVLTTIGIAVVFAIDIDSPLHLTF